MKYEVYFIHLPMKMEPIVSSETSAIRTQAPGNYPKRNKLQGLGCLSYAFILYYVVIKCGIIEFP